MTRQYEFEPEGPGGPRLKRPLNSQLGLRQVQKVDTQELERVPMKFVALALIHLRNQVEKIARMVVDQSKRVDEYQVQTLTIEADATVTNPLEVLPVFEVGEIIESIIVTGPAGAFTLQLGDRVWNLVMPASQFFFIGAPMGMMLSRNDRRLLSSSVAGEWTLELMGRADTRGNII